MDCRKIVESIPVAKWEILLDRFVDLILTSKNEEKMPSQLANMILRYWQQDILKCELGLSALLEASLLLEPEKTVNAFSELQMENIVDQIKAESQF